MFVALWPPEGVVEHLQTTVAELTARVGVRPGVRWVAAPQLHLTVAFLGEVDPLHRSRFEERMGRVCARHAPVTLRLAKAGRFGERVLFVGLDGDRQRLRHLAGSVSAAGRKAGLDLEDRPFRAHLTLARGREGSGFRQLAEALADYRSDSWTADQVHLVHSRLGAGDGGRPAYQTVASWPLTGR
jgi:2'-5' RNA ligase